MNIKKELKENKVKKYFKGLTIRIFISVIIFLLLAIIIKANKDIKNTILKYIYQENISFTTIKNYYNKYLGGIFPLEKETSNTEVVFSEKLKYQETSKYLDGVKLTVSNNYLVPVIESGLVVYIGEKEGYNNVIIIQGMDGVNIWYGNMTTTSIKLYDYVEEGSLLGETKDTNLYLVYQKDNQFLNYEDYLNK